MLRILYDDFDQKVKNIHDEMDLHHSYKKKKRVLTEEEVRRVLNSYVPTLTIKYIVIVKMWLVFIIPREE